MGTYLLHLLHRLAIRARGLKRFFEFRFEAGNLLRLLFVLLCKRVGFDVQLGVHLEVNGRRFAFLAGLVFYLFRLYCLVFVRFLVNEVVNAFISFFGSCFEKIQRACYFTEVVRVAADAPFGPDTLRIVEQSHIVSPRERSTRARASTSS